MFHVYGIRHHGPGSTRSLLRALEAQEPDCLLIEAPQDAEGILEYMLHPQLEPPVAALLYDPKDPGKASYLPFAAFSPEWQAAQFGLAQGIKVGFMDLPMSIQFKLEEKDEQLRMDLPSAVQEPPAIRDPMGYMASLAGYEDSERWWEATFEQPEHEVDVFSAMLNLNSALRDELRREESPMNRLREAYMRKCLRKAIKDGFQSIAVICGAWHSPALHYLGHFKQKDDNALLKGKRKAKIKATWIPWSYPRLAFQSGYRAGVVSPAYYELLMEHRASVVQHWMAQAAALLREEGFHASAAQAVDAARLANTLANLRQQPIAGIAEMKEAARAVFSGGSDAPLDLIEERLVIGQKVGKVPDDIPRIPLQEDMEARIKSAYLSKYYSAAHPGDKELDLRKPANLKASHLLHQLRLLDIPWGSLRELPDGRLGSFHEHWYLQWQPDYIIRLIQAGMWGNTVYTAACQYVLRQARETEELGELVALARATLLAGMEGIFQPLVSRLEDSAALTKDVYSLLQALPVLTEIQRYGDTRQTDVGAVEELIQRLVPRIAIGLPPALLQIEEAVARDWMQLMVEGNRALSLLEDADQQSFWNRALRQISEASLAHPLLRGLSTRLLYDKEQLSAEAAARAMSYALSRHSEAEQCAFWLEGFLFGSGLLLLNLPELWRLIDNWVRQLPEPAFKASLPMIRRAFSNFSGPERERLLQLVRHGGRREKAKAAEEEPPAGFDQQRAKKVLPTLRLLLGLKEG